MKKEIVDSCLFINDDGEIFRKRCPFYIRLKEEDFEYRKLCVKRIIFEDDNIILYDIGEEENVHHSNYDIISESKVLYLV